MEIDPKYIELMNAEIDREISAEDRALLDAFLEDHPDAGRYREELGETVRFLDAAGTLEPPSGLAQSVMAHIRPDAIEE